MAEDKDPEQWTVDLGPSKDLDADFLVQEVPNNRWWSSLPLSCHGSGTAFGRRAK